MGDCDVKGASAAARMPLAVKLPEVRGVCVSASLLNSLETSQSSTGLEEGSMLRMALALGASLGSGSTSLSSCLISFTDTPPPVRPFTIADVIAVAVAVAPLLLPGRLLMLAKFGALPGAILLSDDDVVGNLLPKISLKEQNTNLD